MTNKCRKCGREHEIYYFANVRQAHLVMLCGKRRVYLPYVADLPIPTRKSQHLLAWEAEIEERHQQMNEECDAARDRDRT